jgi:hypothetical protein
MSQGVTEAEPKSPRAPLFVWWSTEATVRDRIPSALAALEVLIAVGTYWAIAIYFETYTHLWVSICVAPLLLLRSDQSIALGADWFAKSWKRPLDPEIKVVLQSYDFYVGLFASLIVSALVSYFLYKNWLSGRSGWALFWRSSVAGYLAFEFGWTIAVIARPMSSWFLGTVQVLAILATSCTSLLVMGAGGGAATTSASTLLLAVVAPRIIVRTTFITKERAREIGALVVKVSVAFLVYPAEILALWLKSLTFRFAATVCHLNTGFWAIPKNFVHTLFLVDIFHSAELMPGYRDDDAVFTSNGLIRDFMHSESWEDRVFDLFLIPTFLIPTYAYRLSIKSTCWLYLPLVYIASEQNFGTTPAHVLDRLWRTPWEWWRRVLAVCSLVGFIITSLAYKLSLLSEPFKSKFVSQLEFLFLIEFHSLKPWQLLNLLSAIITIYLFFAAGDVRVDERHALDANSKSAITWKVEWLKLLMRLRNVGSSVLIIILGVHVLLLFSPAMNYLPTYIISILSNIYGEYMPSWS